jgi:hypothetical protein
MGTKRMLSDKALMRRKKGRRTERIIMNTEL